MGQTASDRVLSASGKNFTELMKEKLKKPKNSQNLSKFS
jgi:hypothetical protein